MERKIFKFESTILDDVTLKKEGYLPSSFGKTSTKYIWATCRYCGEPSRLTKGNFNKQGSACHKTCRILVQKQAGSPFSDPSIREKATKNRYNNYSQEDINKKISEGRRKAQLQIEQTNIEKYGVANPFQSTKIKEKIKITNIEKYGVTHPQQNAEIQQKTINTCVEKYGAVNPLMVPEIRDKIQQTCLNTYGYQNPMQNKEISNKSKNAFKEAVKENESGLFHLINTLRGNEFWKRMADGLCLDDLSIEFCLNYGSMTYHLVQEEFINKYHATYKYPRQIQQTEVFNEICKMIPDTKRNDRQTLNGLELDIFVPSHNFAVEFNGSYWHSEAILDVKEARNKHRNKTDLCRDKNIRLFHLFENIWQDKKYQVLSFFRSALGCNQIKINGRECTIAEDTGSPIIDENHIQGGTQNTIKSFDLIYNGECVGSMTAARHHRQMANSGIIVLSRLVFKNNTTVRGGASRLFKHFVNWAKTCNYNKVLSWSDSAWTEGQIYEHLGFDFVREYRPDYFYWDMSKNKYISKQSQKKSNTGCPNNIKERDWALSHGLYRIWDCGKKLWEFKI